MLVLLPAFAVPGCSGSTPTRSDTPATTRLEVRDFRFIPAQVTVRPGQVTLRLVNAGQATHNLSIPSVPVDVDVDAGGTRTVIFVLPAAGARVELFCKFHRDQGMTGAIRVG